MNELIANLRALADRLESANLNPQCDPNVQIHFHRIQDREGLAEVVRLMESPVPDSNDGCHWISGTICGIKSNAFYRAGLLGKTKKTTVVEVEDKPDLSSLYQPEEATA